MISQQINLLKLIIEIQERMYNINTRLDQIFKIKNKENKRRKLIEYTIKLDNTYLKDWGYMKKGEIVNNKLLTRKEIEARKNKHAKDEIFKEE